MEFFNRLRWVLETSAMCFGGIHDNIGSQVDQLQNEFVRMQRLNFVLLKNFARKVLQIHSDDHLSLAADRRSKYMAVVFVRQAQGGNQVLIALYERVQGRFVHQLPSTFQLFPRKVQ